MSATKYSYQMRPTMKMWKILILLIFYFSFIKRRWYNGQHSCLPSSWSGFDSRPVFNPFLRRQKFPTPGAEPRSSGWKPDILAVRPRGTYSSGQNKFVHDPFHNWKKLRRPGIEPGSTAWKAAMLTIIPPTPYGPQYGCSTIWTSWKGSVKSVLIRPRGCPDV